MFKLSGLRIVFSFVFCLQASCLLSVAETGTDALLTDVSFDQDLYAYYLSTSVADVTGIIDAFESRQYSLLPIMAPDPDFIHLQDGGLLPFDPADFPKRVVRQLIPVDEDGITVYPITVMEMPDTGERQILNALGDVIAEIKPPKDYDPLWYVQLKFPDLATLDPAKAAWQTALYDPSRIMVRFNLITEETLIEKVTAESLSAQQSLIMTPMALSYPATGLAFDSLSVQTNGTVDVTMSWPSGTLAAEGLDIFSCSNLLNQQWSILLTTNVNNAAGSFGFSAPAAADGEKRFLDAWTHFDSDSDTLYDGREVRVYGTDRYDADTDDDGMPDGWEQTNSLDPLDDTDADEDADSDGLSNLKEYQAGTDPNVADSDGDGLSDGAEAYWSRVSVWGTNSTEVLSIPTNLTDVVSVVAGGTHALALHADGTITGWGLDDEGQISGASGISNAVQVAAGYDCSFALLADGSVAAWGNNIHVTNMPSGLTSVVSIVAGNLHGLALLADGSVVGWGLDFAGQVSGATNIDNVIAVDVGALHSMALLADGSVAVWGGGTTMVR
jgi:hypothetical protein